LGRSCRWMQADGEIAAPERYWCGNRRFPGSQAWLRGCMASPSKGVSPTANAGPFSREAMPRILRRKGVATPSKRGDANECGALRDLAPTGEAVFTSLAAQSLRQTHLTYPAGVRDSAKSGWGRKGNHRLNDLAESTCMNRRGCPETDLASSRPEKPGQRRSRHSSRRLGKPATRRRAAVCQKLLSRGNRRERRNSSHECR
jgi:hypothetical protein